MTVKITENPQVSQPGPFSRGQTAVVADSGIEVEQKGGNMFLFAPGVALDDIVKSVNALGASPGDLVAILEALKQAVAPKGKLIVILGWRASSSPQIRRAPMRDKDGHESIV